MKYRNTLELKVGEALENLKHMERALKVYNYLTQNLDFKEFKAFEIATTDHRIKSLLELNILSESEKRDFLNLL